MTKPSWEAQVLFPARLLAGAPPPARAKLEAAGRALYTLILEGFNTDESQRPLLVELQPLVVELIQITHSLRGLEGLDEVAHELEPLVTATLEELVALGSAERIEESAAQNEAGRPFARTLSSEPEFQEAITALSEGLSALCGTPPAEGLALALATDLRWIHTVLECHIANRAEVSGIGPGEIRLCDLAGRLAAQLRSPSERLVAITRTLQEDDTQEVQP